MELKFKSTEYATTFFDNEWVVRHVFRDEQDRRCTAFYSVENEGQANVLRDALNVGVDNE